MRYVNIETFLLGNSFDAFLNRKYWGTMLRKFHFYSLKTKMILKFHITFSFLYLINKQQKKVLSKIIQRSKISRCQNDPNWSKLISCWAFQFT